MPHEHAKLWDEVESFDEVRLLTEMYITGEIKFLPGYVSENLAEESATLIPHLAGYNRAGFLTTTSQPGMHIGLDRQRAFVDGYAKQDVTQQIEHLGLIHDLHVVALPPGESGGFETAVSLKDGLPTTWTGASFWNKDLEQWEEMEVFIPHCKSEAIDELRKCWYVCAIDMNWGREKYLWKSLSDALCVSLRPWASVYQGADFSTQPQPPLPLSV